MLSPQDIVSKILPEMQAALGAGNVMSEARASAPSFDHFNPAQPGAAAPLVQLDTVQPTHSFEQKFEM